MEAVDGDCGCGDWGGGGVTATATGGSLADGIGADADEGCFLPRLRFDFEPGATSAMMLDDGDAVAVSVCVTSDDATVAALSTFARGDASGVGVTLVAELFEDLFVLALAGDGFVVDRAIGEDCGVASMTVSGGG